MIAAVCSDEDLCALRRVRSAPSQFQRGRPGYWHTHVRIAGPDDDEVFAEAEADLDAWCRRHNEGGGNEAARMAP